MVNLESPPQTVANTQKGLVAQTHGAVLKYTDKTASVNNPTHIQQWPLGVSEGDLLSRGRKESLESIPQTSRQQEQDRRKREIGADNEGECGMNGVAD